MQPLSATRISVEMTSTDTCFACYGSGWVKGLAYLVFNAGVDRPLRRVVNSYLVPCTDMFLCESISLRLPFLARNLAGAV